MTDSAGTAVITSLHNQGIKRARSLLRRKGRTEERAFLVEGVRAVTDAIATGIAPQAIYLRDDPEGWRLHAELEGRAPIRMATSAVIDSLSDVSQPQPIVAEFAIDDLPNTPQYDVWQQDLILLADGVRDPGNMGTLIRTAAGAGVTEVIVSPESVDPFNPKCVRSAMGTHFLVPVRQLTVEETVDRLREIPLIALADASASQEYDQLDWRQPCAIIVGGEAFGANQPIRAAANAYVRIPLARNLESLNAGVAGSHLILEAARQRRPGQVRQSPVR